MPGSPQECELRRLLAQARSGELELLCWCAPLPCHPEVVRSALLWLAREEGGRILAALPAEAARIGCPEREDLPGR